MSGKVYDKKHFYNACKVFNSIYKSKEELNKYCNSVVFDMEEKSGIHTITNLDYHISVTDKTIRITDNTNKDYTLNNLFNTFCSAEMVKDGVITDIPLNDFFLILEIAMRSITYDLKFNNEFKKTA